MSSSRPATNTGIAAMNSTGHNQVKVMLLGPSTSKPARLPASTAKPPTRGVARECVACGLFMSESPVKIPSQRSGAKIKPPTKHAPIQIQNQIQEYQDEGETTKSKSKERQRGTR